MKQLCVLGSLHLDVVVSADNLPQIDETVVGSEVNYVFGGKGGNQALAADGHGANVYFIGRVGKDAFGETLLATLRNSSIDTSQVKQDTGASGMSVAIINQQGDYGAVIVSESNLRIDNMDVMISEKTGILLLQNEVPEEINLSASAKAMEQGSQVWLNAAPARKISKELLNNLDVVIMNRPEALYYGDLFVSDESNHIIKVFTLGSEGLEVHFPNNKREYHAAHVIDVQSTHGAGDMFVGALAANYLKNNNFSNALKYAQAAAAIKVSRNAADRTSVQETDVFKFLGNS